MKIRTRLLLSLLPALIGNIVLIAILSEMSFVIIGIALFNLVTIVSLFFITSQISTPIQKLNNSALAIAAGRYGESIEVQGPKELQELANTLNTMSECLLENINRLKENALHLERVYGEAECTRLLQHLMLQKNIDECPSDAIIVKAISFPSTATRGLLLDFPHSENPEILHIHLAEAIQDGFDGMYQLLMHSKSKEPDRLFQKPLRKARLPFPTLSLSLDREHSQLVSKSIHCEFPFLWSMSSLELTQLDGKRLVEAGDFIFLMNQGLGTFFKGQLSELLNKILKHFAEDGLEVVVTMLQKEIAFATKRKELEEDLHLICIQILTPISSQTNYTPVGLKL